MQKSVFSYMHENVFITTSGIFDQATFTCALTAVGIEHILFSVDDPLADNFEAMEFLKATHLSPEEREQLAHGNAERLLNLSTDAHVRSGSGSNPQSSLFAFRARAKSKLARMLLSFLVK